jgi:hypothetical protein
MFCTRFGQRRRLLCRNVSFLGEKKITLQLNITNEKFRAPLADFESLDFLNVAERVENAVSSSNPQIETIVIQDRITQ